MDSERERMQDSYDDWVSKERRREARLSVWSMDDNALYIKQEHEDHCEREEVSQYHQQRHQAGEILQQKISENIQKRVKNQQTNNKSGKSLIIVIIFIIYAIMMILNLFI